MTTPSGALNIPDAYQLAVHYNDAGQPAESVLGFAHVSPSEMPDQAKWLAVLNAWWSAMRPLCSTNVTVTGATARECVPDGLVVETGAPTNPAGTGTGTSLSAYSTLILWRTSRGGRSGKGRTFLPGPTTSAIAGGGRSYATTHSTATAAAVTSFLNNAELDPLAGLYFAVISRADQAAYPVTSGALAAIPGVQRRRMRA